MKNFKLLLATTAILSVGAMNAKAADVTSTSLQTKVGIVQQWNIRQGTPLNFGVVTAKNNGEMTLSANDGNVTTDLTVVNTIAASPQRGSIFVEGGRAVELGESYDQIVNSEYSDEIKLTAIQANSAFASNWLSFSEATPLKDTQDDSIVCGTTPVDAFTTRATAKSTYVQFDIGGKLILADDIEQKIANTKRKLNCIGSVTVTNIAAVNQ